MDALEKFPIDIRLRDINLKRGVISRQDIEKHLQELPDDAGNATNIVLDQDTHKKTDIAKQTRTS